MSLIESYRRHTIDETSQPLTTNKFTRQYGKSFSISKCECGIILEGLFVSLLIRLFLLPLHGVSTLYRFLFCFSVEILLDVFSIFDASQSFLARLHPSAID